MFIKPILLFALVGTALAAPDGAPAAKKNAKRQANMSELSVLASIAGITALPTDPAARSSLQAVAGGLAAILPNPSVFSVLETAVPHSLISQLANNPAAASSFESQFAAGSTPAWFSSLPTDVRSYLHTYQPSYGVLASATNSTQMNMTQTSSSSMSSSTGSTSMSSSGGGADASSSQAALSSAAAAAASASSKSSTGGAPKATGAVAAGILGAVGILGLAVAL